MGKQCLESPTVGKISKKSKNKGKNTGLLALGDVESTALTRFDEKFNEPMLARALEGREAQPKNEQEKEQSGIPEISISAGANQEQDWSQFKAWNRYCRKTAKIKQERDAEELAALVGLKKQQLTDKAKAVQGDAIQQGAGNTSNVSTPEPNGMSGVSNTSIGGTAANKNVKWGHLTEARMIKKLAKAWKEWQAEDYAELTTERAAKLLNEAQQQMADGATAAQQGAGSCG